MGTIPETREPFHILRGATLALLFLLSTAVLRAQTTVLVNNNAGDSSAPNSLGWAVTTLNAAGAGTVSFGPFVSTILLSQALAPFSNAVTFTDNFPVIIGQNDAQAQLLFQSSFNQLDSFDLLNNGGLSAGLDASVTAASWAMDPSVVVALTGGSAAGVNTSGGTGVTGPAGGNASVTVGTWTLGNTVQLYGGSGAGVTDSGGTADVGGTGGSAAVTASSLILSSTNFQLSAGAGGSVTDLTGGTNTGGAGGSAFVASNFVSIGTFSSFSLSGGIGGSGVTGGAGGGATLLAGSVSLASSFSVQGGNGGNGINTGGNGGSASVSFGTLTQSFNGRFMVVTGGNGGASSSSSGDGGDASVVGGSVSLTGSSGFQVSGGGGGSLGFGPGGTVNGGNGGNASVSLATFSDSSNAAVIVAGGNGGAGSLGTSSGNGGQGGNTSLSLGAFTIAGSNLISFGGGAGGAGGDNSSNGTGGTGGQGGTLGVTFGNLTLSSGSSLTLTGNSGGAGGNSPGGTGGAGGNGGNLSLSVGGVTLASGNNLDIAGGAGGAGGTGTTNGSNGISGQASAVIGDLEGQGSLSMTGTNALLQVSSGTFGGVLQGNEILNKTGSGALTLSGASSYSGGTSVTAGTLSVDTGGVLGTGGIINNANLNFINNATAGSAIITTNSSGKLQFLNNSTGANAQLITNGTGVVDFSFSNASTAAGGPMTVGSIAGNGTYDLGRVDLITGGNNQSTTVSGTLADGGSDGGTGASLTKMGTGTLTLSEADSYTGGTNINAGILTVGNATALGSGSVTVNGGTLAVAGPLLASIGGNYTQTSGGTLQLGLGGLSAANQDELNIAGNASVAGTLNLITYNGLTAPPLGQISTILATGGSLSGTFQNVNESFTGMRFLPLYLSNAVELESIIPSFQRAGATPNQIAIGADLDSIVFNPSFTGLMAQLGVMSNSSFQTADDQLSPAGLAALYLPVFERVSLQAGLAEQRLAALRSGSQGNPGSWADSRMNGKGEYPLFASTLSPLQESRMTSGQQGQWNGNLSWNQQGFTVAGDGNGTGYQSTSGYLLTVDIDNRFSKSLALGFQWGYSSSAIDLNGTGAVTEAGGQAGVYGTWFTDSFYLNAMAQAGYESFQSSRLGFGGTAVGTTPGIEFGGQLGAGYDFKAKNLTFGPMASVRYTKLNVSGFTEQGSLAPLTLPAQSEDSFLGQAGAQANGSFKIEDVKITPSVSVAWEHEFDYQGGNVLAGFGQGDNFTVAGSAIGQDGFLVRAGLGIGLAKNLGLSLDYQGELGRTNITSQQFGGGLGLSF